MRWVSECIPKQISLPKIVGTERRVSEVVRQRIPGHRTGDRERPTAEHAATMSWYDEMCRTYTLKIIFSSTIAFYKVVH